MIARIQRAQIFIVTIVVSCTTVLGRLSCCTTIVFALLGLADVQSRAIRFRFHAASRHTEVNFEGAILLFGAYPLEAFIDCGTIAVVCTAIFQAGVHFIEALIAIQ